MSLQSRFCCPSESLNWVFLLFMMVGVEVSGGLIFAFCGDLRTVQLGSTMCFMFTLHTWLLLNMRLLLRAYVRFFDHGLFIDQHCASPIPELTLLMSFLYSNRLLNSSVSVPHS